MNRCHICGRWGYTERHHIFGGANRRRSERDGLVVNLCVLCHREGRDAAHKSADTAQQLHEYGQRLWMQRTGGTVDDFRGLFGKNYLDDDAPIEIQEPPRESYDALPDVLGF